MVQIDQRIKDALRDAADRIGTKEELAKRAGVSKSNIGKYINGGITVIRPETFQKLQPSLELDDKEEDKVQKSILSPALVEIFEQLSYSNQGEVLRFADRLLEGQSRLTLVEPFTDEELEKLSGKGISCKYHYEFTISTRGLWWLYNVLLCSRKIGEELNNQLFKALLKLELPKDACRELRVKMFQMDVYNDKQYDILAIYLNGSPPKYFTPYTDVNRISQVFRLKHSQMAPFELSDDSIYELEFTDAEFEALQRGETLKISGGE